MISRAVFYGILLLAVVAIVAAIAIGVIEDPNVQGGIETAKDVLGEGEDSNSPAVEESLWKAAFQKAWEAVAALEERRQESQAAPPPTQ